MKHAAVIQMAVRVTCRQNDLSTGRCLLWSLRESDEVKASSENHWHTHTQFVAHPVAVSEPVVTAWVCWRVCCFVKENQCT